MSVHRTPLALGPASATYDGDLGVEPDGLAAAAFEELCHLTIQRRERLERLRDLNAPGIIVRNEERMLRAAATALIEHCQSHDIAPAVAAYFVTAVRRLDASQDGEPARSSAPIPAITAYPTAMENDHASCS